MNDAQKLQFASEKSSIHFFYSPPMSVIGPSNFIGAVPVSVCWK